MVRTMSVKSEEEVDFATGRDIISTTDDFAIVKARCYPDPNSHSNCTSIARVDWWGP